MFQTMPRKKNHPKKPSLAPSFLPQILTKIKNHKQNIKLQRQSENHCRFHVTSFVCRYASLLTCICVWLIKYSSKMNSDDRRQIR